MDEPRAQTRIMPSMKTVTFYTRRECGLCTKAETILRQVARSTPFQWVTVDIAKDPRAFRKYSLDIPVVLIDGVEHARHSLDEQALRRALRP